MMPSSQSRLNRRHFAAAVSASALIASSPRLFAESANEQMGVCIVGLNGRGAEHIRGFHKDPRTTITAIVDIDDAVGARRAKQIEELQGTRPEVFKDVRHAIEKGKFDILACATPNHWHALCGVWAMQAGKDVYIEKPISHNIHEGRALVAAATKYGRVFPTGTQCRSSEACIGAMKFIAEGGIGDVNFARGLCYKRRKSIGSLGDYSVPEGVDFDLWSGPATLDTTQVDSRRISLRLALATSLRKRRFGHPGPSPNRCCEMGPGTRPTPQHDHFLRRAFRLSSRTQRSRLCGRRRYGKHASFHL